LLLLIRRFSNPALLRGVPSETLISFLWKVVEQMQGGWMQGQPQLANY
jgi:hypothetical protein